MPKSGELCSSSWGDLQAFYERFHLNLFISHPVVCLYIVLAFERDIKN